MAVNWLKQGTDAVQMAQAHQAKVEAAKNGGGAYRFWIKEGDEARITFVDGDLVMTEAGPALGQPRYYEHNIQMDGKWGNTFVCPKETVPEAHYDCPLCAAGDRPALVALFTIIDHREYTDKSGKTHKDQRRLFVAKAMTMELLTKIAIKRQGLAGVTFDVSRMGPQSASVGSMFDFQEKNEVSAWQQHLLDEVTIDGKTVTQSRFTPFDYASEIKFMTPEEMLAAGLGKAGGAPKPSMTPGGSAMSPGGAMKKPGGMLPGKLAYADKL